MPGHLNAVRPLLLGGCLTAALVALVAPPTRADEAIPFARVAPLFQKHCASCHGVDKAKGDLRLDKLNPDLLKGGDADRWREVHDRLNFGDMPPAGAPALGKDDRELMLTWLTQERRRAALAKNQATTFRRLTRREYERTLQDLLGLPIEFGARLTEDGRSKEGFRNDGDVLRMSPLQYETFLQIADDALAEAIVTGPPPAVHRYRIALGEKFAVTSLPKPAGRPGESFEYVTTKGKAFSISSMAPLPKDWAGGLPPSAIRRFSEAAVQVPERCFAVNLQQAFRKGETRIRVHAARLPQEGTRPPMLTVALGSSNFHGVELKVIGDPAVVEHAESRTYEFRVRMENVSVPNVGPLNAKNATVLAVWNSARAVKGEAKPPLLKVEWLEFENPCFDTWPPQSHTNILFAQGDLEEAAYAREVVRRFAERAYRGPVAAAEVDRLMAYWKKARPAADSLEVSLRETLGVVLSSPRFLGLPASRSGAGKERLTDHELAARLSYWLWSTQPDEPLRKLADSGKLREPTTLAEQVRRMIRDPRAGAFIEQFADQWLDLDRLQRVTFSKERYPGTDDALLAAMRLESIHFFGEVLRGDHSVLRFLDADFTCVNETLAAHYGIANVTGPAFRKVQLEATHQRGGVLTHAGILAGNSDGRDGHPIKRGMWLLKNLLDETPPPPPPNVPELNREDPKVKNLTIPQALAVHRNSPACVGCHKKIDPWGIAFEEYDAVGNWQRDGAGAALRQKRTSKPVEAEAELPSGVKVNGMRELRQELLRTRADDFRRALARKLLAYALGRALTLTDVEVADALVPALRKRDDRLATLLELIASSEPFTSK